MAKSTTTIKTSVTAFQQLEKLLKPYGKASRNPSCDFLVWFLETIYRLDDIEARDAVCDNQDDAGIDGLLVDESARSIVLFQAKRRETADKTLGDTDLKQFVGSISQFRTKKNVEELIKSAKVNVQLQDRLKELQVAEKVGDGYRVEPIFITNVAANEHALAYLKQHSEKEGIDLWDQARLKPVLKQIDHDWFVNEAIDLYADGSVMEFGKAGVPDLVFAAVKAKGLIKLPGITDTRLFAQNVRLGLGNTSVNRDIVSSIKDAEEHPNFLTFHNGLTIVSKNVSVTKNKISIKDFSVCNGCQSLLSFEKHKAALTNKLSVLVRIVRVGDGRESAATIAHRTNNQNAISLRDLSSNDTTQTALRKEFNKLFGKYSTYLIKRGEDAKVGEFTNELAGRLLLSIYVREPWRAHQKYRIFGDLETRIFNFRVNAAKIRLVQIIDEVVQPNVAALKHAQIARYGLTRFIFCYLVAELMRASSDGASILQDPLDYLRTTKANAKEAVLVKALQSLTDFVSIELNYFFGDEQNKDYNYKTNFKAMGPVNTIRDLISKSYEKDVKRNKQDEFSV